MDAKSDWTRFGCASGPVRQPLGLANTAEIKASFSGILAVANWLPLAVVWTALKLWHELGHALACRQYGVEVRRCGIVFILFAPCPYVDATAAWELRSKWPRIHIAAAGILAELMVAALVLLAWPVLSSGVGLGLDPAWTKQLAANALFSATVATLLFNANPLMKFDGYFIVSDLFGVSNLSSRGSQAISARISWVLFGSRPRTREPIGIELYGWAALVWRIVVTVSLVAAASVLIPGVGLWIGIAGAVVSFVPPLLAAIQTLKSHWEQQLVGRPLVTGGILLAATCGLLMMRWPFGDRFAAVVTVPDDAIVRAESSGFVESVLVSHGEKVRQRQPVVRLCNEELDTKKKELEAEIARSIARERMFEADDRLSDAQVEADDRYRLRTQLALTQDRLDDTVVTPSRAGIFQADTPLAELIGAFVNEGDELATISFDGPVHIEAAVPDRLIDSVRQHDGAYVMLVAPNGKTYRGTVQRIEPSAKIEPISETLFTHFGGPIAATHDAESGGLLAERPHFKVTIESPARVASELPLGTRLTARFGSSRTTARALFEAATDWWEELVVRESAAR